MAAIRPIRRLLIANRGEIACRIMRTARTRGIHCIAVYTGPDADALHTALADEAHAIPADSYLARKDIIKISKATRADAIHPGYGFLSENAAFARDCEKADVIFVGPPASAIEAMGEKDRAKRLMEDAGVPVVPGYHGKKQDTDHLKKEAEKIGYPVLIKAVSGGGGKGMRKVDSAGDFAEALEGARREAKAAFGDDRVLVEKYIETPRHIEVQVFADSLGGAVHLYERDCSLQRRHQKIIEEAPAPDMTEGLRTKMTEAAVRAAEAIGYVGAGTVEFIVDGEGGLADDTDFFFMEMNTRLQVEHPVSEMVTGTDLVDWQLRVAEGHPLPRGQKEITLSGHSIEARLYAEDPARDFMPQTGVLDLFDLGENRTGERVETGLREGDEVTVHFDPMIAKLVVHGPDRTSAIQSLTAMIDHAAIAGVTTNMAFLRAALRDEDFAAGKVSTRFVENKMEALFEAGAVTPAVLAAAFTAIREARREARGKMPSPWTHMEGFRLNLPYREHLSLALGGEEIDLTYTLADGRETLKWQDKEATFTGKPAGSDRVEIALNGAEERLAARKAGEAVHVVRKGTTYSFRILDPLAVAEADMEGPGQVTAPMPGAVTDVKVAEGETVEKDQPLLIMEAMKMELTIRAPRAGTVETLTVATGDQVSEGAELLRIVDDDDDD